MFLSPLLLLPRKYPISKHALCLSPRLFPSLNARTYILMDIFSLASSLTSTLNPLQNATFRHMSGTTQAANYSLQAVYEDHPTLIDIHPTPSGMLQLLDDITQQNESRLIYMRGTAHTLSRPLQCGGDSLIFEGSEWLITKILEQWGANEWCKLIVTRQIPAQPPP